MPCQPRASLNKSEKYAFPLANSTTCKIEICGIPIDIHHRHGRTIHILKSLTVPHFVPVYWAKLAAI